MRTVFIVEQCLCSACKTRGARRSDCQELAQTSEEATEEVNKVNKVNSVAFRHDQLEETLAL